MQAGGKGRAGGLPRLTRPCGLCSHTALAFSMMEAAMTASPLGNGLSSCLHSSCTTPPPSPGPAAAASTSPGSWSKPCPGGEGGCRSGILVPEGGEHGGQQLELGAVSPGWKERPSELCLTASKSGHTCRRRSGAPIQQRGLRHKGAEGVGKAGPSGVSGTMDVCM